MELACESYGVGSRKQFGEFSNVSLRAKKIATGACWPVADCIGLFDVAHFIDSYSVIR